MLDYVFCLISLTISSYNVPSAKVNHFTYAILFVGRVRQVVIGSKEQAAECMNRLVRRKVMLSSTRQAVAGLLTAGAIHGVRYVANKMRKAWKSWA